jgi:hypothetical protein
MMTMEPGATSRRRWRICRCGWARLFQRIFTYREA